MKAAFERSTITARSPERLAWMYGYEGLRDLVSSLPENAVVIDVGSGNSKFGKGITEMRGDVNCLNLDLYYGRYGAHRWRQKHSPSNLNFVAGNALELPLRPGTVDRVFSSALLPHIVMSGHEAAISTVHSMAELLKEDGLLSIAGFGYDDFLHITASDYYDNPDASAQRVVNEMALHPTDQRMQKIVNTVFYYTGMTAINRLLGYS